MYIEKQLEQEALYPRVEEEQEGECLGMFAMSSDRIGGASMSFLRPASKHSCALVTLK